METDDSGRPRQARRLVLRKIARPEPTASVVPTPPPQPAPSRRPAADPPAARQDAGPPSRPSAARPPSPSFAQVDPARDIYESAGAPAPAEWAAALRPARASLSAVAATLPPEPATAPPTVVQPRSHSRWVPSLIVSAAGVVLALAVTGIVVGQRPAQPAARGAPATPGPIHAAPPSSLADHPTAAAQSTAAIDLLPETPVEALPKASVPAKPSWAGRRLDPVATPAQRPAAHPRTDHAIAAGGDEASAEQPTPASTPPSVASATAEGDEAPEVQASARPPAVNPLVKAIQDDIEEEEARHK